jgi:hypothetical protein
MANRYAVFGWSIDLAPGWTAEIRQETSLNETTAFLAIVPETGDALLRLTPDTRGIMGADEWVEAVGQINRAKVRRVTAAKCGDFAGYIVQFGTDAEWLRGWAICAGSVPLDATFRCKAENAGRDDPVVEAMLNSLRLNKAG